MKRILPTVSLIVAVFAAPAFAAPTPAPKAVHHKVAPADEYFGKLKMSILGIANTIKDQSIRYERRPEELSSALNSVNFAVDAIHDWQRKYPADPWIAKSLFALERFYAKIDTDDARTLAKQTMQWLVHDFPQTWYGKTGKQELAEGKVGVPPPRAAVQSAPQPIDITKPVLVETSPVPVPPTTAR